MKKNLLIQFNKNKKTSPNSGQKVNQIMELKIRNLSKIYSNGVHALKGITLDIPQGMFGLLGPNGAGKSSLMRTLAVSSP